MRITKWGEYGILCCVQLAHKWELDEPSGASFIAKALGTPLDYTQQILQRLRKAGLLVSVRGPAGGYKLAKAPDSISLKDILYATEGATFEILCDSNSIYSNCSSPTNSCSLQPVWRELQNSIDQVLEAKSLQDISEGYIPSNNSEQLVSLGKRLVN